MENVRVTSAPKARRPTKYTGLSMKERAAARRQDLIEAGIELLGTRGVGATKVSDVCRQAELTERYFYESFTNMAEFTRAVVDTVGIRSGVRLATALLSEKSVEEQGRAVIRECLAIVREDPRVGRIILVETLRAGGELTELRTTVLVAAGNMLKLAMNQSADLDLHDLMQRVVVSGMSGDVLPDELTESADPAVLAMGGAVSEVLVGWAEGRITMSEEELREFLESMFDAAVRASQDGGGLAGIVRGALDR